MSHHNRSVLGALVHGLASVLVASAFVSCGCPSFFNSNCSMDVAVALEGQGEEVNAGNAFQVSVVCVLQAGDPTLGMTNSAWIHEGGRIGAANPQINFSVQLGQIRIDEDARTGSTKFEVSDDGRSIEIDFNSLGHPEEGGYAGLAVFADMRDQLESNAFFVPYATIKANGWKVALKIGPGGIQLDQGSAS